MEALALRDIHLPAELGLWPLAWGWWLLLGLIALLGLGIWWWLRRYRQQRQFRLAAKLLHDILFNPHVDQQQKRVALSQWLRQVAILSAGREQVASLTGQLWREYLDSGWPDQPFTQGIGQTLTHVYSNEPVADWDEDAVNALCLRWLKQQAKRGVTNV